MTSAPPPLHVGVATSVSGTLRPPASRRRRAWSLVGSIALTVLCVLLAMSSGGQHGAGVTTVAPLMQAYSMIGALLMSGVSILLIWRHRFPIVISSIACALTLLLPTTPLPALIALAAVTRAEKGWWRWGLIVGTYLGTVVSFCWDVAEHDSFVADFFGSPAQGTPARLALFWVVPLLAALAVAPFAAFGIGRRLSAERDLARRDTLVAQRTVSALQDEVDRQRERQEIARELHDTLAADLSQVALHAGALELIVGDGDVRAVSAARVVRESTQHSLDDLRRMVKSLRDHELSIAAENGLGDLPRLVDDALRDGTDVRAQIIVSDPTTCSARIAHACYRIVQETISNVRRHAPGAALYLEVRGAPADGLSIRAVNWLVPHATPTSQGGGHGLQGIAERARLAGGTVQAGATPEGSFAVIVWLPWSDV